MSRTDLKSCSEAFFLIRSGLYGTCSILVESTTFLEKYIRHNEFVCWLETNDGSYLFEEGATFFVKNSLVNDSAGFVSFEPVNFQGYYLRHLNYQLKFSKNDSIELFRNYLETYLKTQ